MKYNILYLQIYKFTNTYFLSTIDWILNIVDNSRPIYIFILKGVIEYWIVILYYLLSEFTLFQSPFTHSGVLWKGMCHMKQI